MIDLGFFLLLVVTGFIAGIINTLAGGGSNLTIPALMLLGMPADVANATNRVGVLLQSASGVIGFNKNKKLPTADLPAIVIITIVGGVCGAIAALYIPANILKYVLLISMCSMALVMIFAPSVIVPEAGTVESKVKNTPKAWLGLFIAGFYGGLIQAGVGFILLAALCGVLRYDLVRANALKLVCTFVFTLCALLIFIVQGLVQWLPGIALALGSVVGAWIAVKFAISIAPKTMKILLLVMTVIASVAVIFQEII